jgi:hypothetical protein
MFTWFQNAGFKGVKTIRELAVTQDIPNWVKYSLPDALWVYSFTCFMLITWDHKFTRQSVAWLLIAPMSGIVSEIGQAFQLISGTFDLMDLILILIAATLPFILIIKNNKLYENFKN